MQSKTIHIIGGAEIVIGGAQIVNPQLVPSWIGFIIILVGVFTIAYPFWRPSKKVPPPPKLADIEILQPTVTHAVWKPAQPQPIEVKCPSSKFVHVIVCSSMPVRDCEVRVNSITRVQDGVRAAIGQPFNLVTSGGAHYRNITTPADDETHFDLVFTIEGENLLGIAPDISVSHAIGDDFFSTAGNYDFEISASGVNATTSKAVIRVIWDGQWDSIKAKRLLDGTR